MADEWYESQPRQNPTARENVLTYKRNKGEVDANTPMMATVTADEDVEGVPTRVLTDIRSEEMQESIEFSSLSDKNWLKKGLETELNTAVAEDRAQIAIPIKTDSQLANDMARSPGTQEWYETQVVDTAKKVARETGSAFENKKVGNTEYAVVKPEGKSRPPTPSAVSMVVYEAYKNGMSEEEVNKKLISKYGYDEDDLDEVKKRVEVINLATMSGMSLGEIGEEFRVREVNAYLEESLPLGGGDSVYWLDPAPLKETPKRQSFISLQEADNAKDALASMQVIYPSLTTYSNDVAAFFGNKAAQQTLNAANNVAKDKITQLMQKMGYDAYKEGDNWFINTEQGPQPITPSFWDELSRSLGETSGALAGAYMGAKTALIAGQAGPQAAFPEEVATVPLGMLGGAIAGSVVGTQTDYLRELVNLQQDFDFQVAAYKTLNASEATMAGEIIGIPLGKGLGVALKGVADAKEFIFNNDSVAAYKALKDILYLTDDQIDEIVFGLKKFVDLEGTRKEQAVKALVATQPRMQGLVQAASKENVGVPFAVSKDATERAKQLTEMMDNPLAANKFKDDLTNYVLDVKEQYKTTVKKAAQTPKGLNFRFDFDKLAVMPVLEDLFGKIKDPTVNIRVYDAMQKIGTYSESRNFADLVSLRQVVNDLLYNKRIKNYDDKKTLQKLKSKIDSGIKEGASQIFDDPKPWLDEWGNALTSYSEMKQVVNKDLYKTIFDKEGKVKARNPEQVVKSMSKYMSALDGSFQDILDKLPKNARGDYENASINVLLDKYTAELEGGEKAIDFPKLSKELQKITFTTPEARTNKKMIDVLSETFKNDVNLAALTFNIVKPQYGGNLSDDLVTKFRYEMIGKSYAKIRSKFPGKANRQIALVNTIADLMDNPMNAKSLKEFRDGFADSPEMLESMLRFQQQYSKENKLELDAMTPSFTIYKGGKFKGEEEEIAKIKRHRIADYDTASKIAEQNALTMQQTKLLDAVLYDYGYKAVMSGTDRVRLLKGN